MNFRLSKRFIWTRQIERFKKLMESLTITYSESVKMNNFVVLIKALIFFYSKGFTFHQVNNSSEF